MLGNFSYCNPAKLYLKIARRMTTMKTMTRSSASRRRKSVAVTVRASRRGCTGMA